VYSCLLVACFPSQINIRNHLLRKYVFKVVNGKLEILTKSFQYRIKVHEPAICDNNLFCFPYAEIILNTTHGHDDDDDDDDDDGRTIWYRR
jgi:hypothetical protein